jgi:hypothetical protein
LQSSGIWKKIISDHVAIRIQVLCQGKNSGKKTWSRRLHAERCGEAIYATTGFELNRGRIFSVKYRPISLEWMKSL